MYEFSVCLMWKCDLWEKNIYIWLFRWPKYIFHIYLKLVQIFGLCPDSQFSKYLELPKCWKPKLSFFCSWGEFWKSPKNGGWYQWNQPVNSVQFSSVAQSCATLCNPVNHSMPGLPVHHQFPEFTRLTSIESVMPSSHLILWRPLLLLPSIPPSIRVFSNESNPSHEVAKVLEFQL